MEANVETKPQTLKSAEQRMIEKAAHEFAEKLRAIFQVPVKAEIEITGVPLSKIAHIAEFMKDDDVSIHFIDNVSRGRKHYINPGIRTEIFRITSISE